MTRSWQASTLQVVVFRKLRFGGEACFSLLLPITDAVTVQFMLLIIGRCKSVPADARNSGSGPSRAKEVLQWLLSTNEYLFHLLLSVVHSTLMDCPPGILPNQVSSRL